jgi:hypothetical protein
VIQNGVELGVQNVYISTAARISLLTYFLHVYLLASPKLGGGELPISQMVVARGVLPIQR